MLHLQVVVALMITSSDIEADRHNQSFILRSHVIYEVSATISMQYICVTEHAQILPTVSTK